MSTSETFRSRLLGYPPLVLGQERSLIAKESDIGWPNGGIGRLQNRDHGSRWVLRLAVYVGLTGSWLPYSHPHTLHRCPQR